MSMLTNKRHGRVLSNDAITDIFSWLPVKSLIRFKCISKPWHAIIRSMYFISLHLTNYGNSDASERLLATFYSHGLYAKLLDDPKLIEISQQRRIDLEAYYYFSGPCNGIFCLQSRSDDTNFTLWNPSTNEKRDLPSFTARNLEYHGFMIHYHGVFMIGIDPVTNDYKVIVIIIQRCDCEKCSMTQVMLYSLAANSWQELETSVRLDQYELDLQTFCTNPNVCYWLAGRSNDDRSIAVVIFSFNLSTNEFGEIQLPPEYDTMIACPIGVYHNSLTAYEVDNYNGTQNIIKIWTLEEEDGSRCWRNLNSIGPLSHRVGSIYGCRPRSGEIIFASRMNANVLFLCDPRISKMREIELSNDECTNAIIYNESIVSIADLQGKEQPLPLL